MKKFFAISLTLLLCTVFAETANAQKKDCCKEKCKAEQVQDCPKAVQCDVKCDKDAKKCDKIAKKCDKKAAKCDKAEKKCCCDPCACKDCKATCEGKVKCEKKCDKATKKCDKAAKKCDKAK